MQHKTRRHSGSHEHGTESHPEHHDVETAHFSYAGAPPAVAHAAAHGHHESASDKAFIKKHGGDRNVSMVHINEHHRQGGHSPSRVAWNGKDPALDHDHMQHHTEGSHEVYDTPVYDDAGTMIGHQREGRVPVNAGQIAHLVIPGHEHAVTCVLTHGSPTGWIPVSRFTHPERLKHEQMKESAAIRRARHQHDDTEHDHDHPGPTFAVRNLPMPPEYADAFTKPHQHADKGNRAVDYFVRPNHHVNLLLNVPTWHLNGHSEGERLGVPDSIVPALEPGAAATPSSTFHKLHGPVHVQLYKQNSAQHHGQLQFVYGYIVNSAGEKRFGWINEALLEVL